MQNINDTKIFGVPIALWLFPPFALMVLTINALHWNKHKKGGNKDV